MYIYSYIYICVCMCACVWRGEGEGGKCLYTACSSPYLYIVYIQVLMNLKIFCSRALLKVLATF